MQVRMYIVSKKQCIALAGSEFRGSIFSCGIIFVDTRCSRSEINLQLRSYTRNVKSIRISTKMELFVVFTHYW